ncbi:MAG: glutamate racemase [Candidatus Gastranaerophilales bacterium]|nr:glutamate racemase [Candidatus Gastranaerophilales bacterium]
MTNNENYIGVLDSGVGGLSVLSQLVKLMPEKNYLFFGDTKNVPYGTKTPQEIFNYTKKILEFFISKNVKHAVFACNTTSAVAYDELKNYFKDKIKIFPLIQSVAKTSIENLKDNETIAILATKATINSKKYNEEIHKINSKINVLGIDCTGFVEIVENRLYNDKQSIELIKSKLDIAKNNNAKRIVLGCTHYPYLEEIFKNILNVEYFNPALCLAQIVKNSLPKNTSNTKGTIQFFVSKNPNEFILSAKTFFDVKEAQLVEL